MAQHQGATADQLDLLRILVENEEYDLDHLTVYEARAIIKIANFNGLYDAADYVSNQTNKTRITLNWGDDD